MIYETDLTEHDPNYTLCKIVPRILADLLLMLLVGLAAYRMALTRNAAFSEAFREYMPILAGELVLLMAYTELTRGNRCLALTAGTLLQIGMALQMLLVLQEHGQPNGSVARYAWILLLTLAAAALFVPGLYAGAKWMGGFHRRYLAAGIALLYLAGCTWSMTVNGSRCWLLVGGVMFRWTLLPVLCSLMLLGITLADTSESTGRRSLDGMLLLAVNAVFLTITADTTLLLVMGIVTALMGLLYPASRKVSLSLTAALLTMVLSCLLWLGICRLWDANASNVPEIVQACSDTFEKLLFRLQRMMAAESNTAASYQLSCARQITAAAQILPNSSTSGALLIPSAGNDYVFSSLLQYFGWLPGLLVLLLAPVMVHSGCSRCVQARTPAVGGAGAALLLFAAVGMLLAASAGVGLIPAIGADYLFLSSSGSYLVCGGLILVYLLGCGSRTPRSACPGVRTLTWGMLAWIGLLCVYAARLMLR